MTNVLIAEDDQSLANAYRIKLTNAGFKVVIEGNGEDLLNALEHYTPDIILLDLVMPIKDGFATLRELKASKQWKNIPVLIASNLGQIEDIARGTELGADGYVIKSDLKLEELITTINTILSSKKPH